MKLRSYISAIAFSFISISSFALTPFPKEHALGFTGGINLSKMGFHPTVVQDYKMGYTGGIVYRYIEEKYFGIQAELLYTRRGWAEKLEDYPDLYFDRSLNYIELPIMSHIFFGNNTFRGFVNLGPKFGFYLGESKHTNITDPSVITNLETAQQTLDVATKFDYGITGGAGIELRFGRNSLLLEGRYYFGLGDIFPNEKKDVFEASPNQNISVAATYLFHINRKR